MFRKMRYIDKTLLFVTATLFVIGLIMVFSASNVTAYMSRATSPYHYFINQSIFIVLGIVISFIMINMFNTKSLGKVSLLGLFIMIGCLIYLLVSHKVRAINNANSWIELGSFNLQPSELVKILSIFWLAYYYDKHKKGLDKWGTVLLPITLCIGICILIAMQPDLGTAFIYSAIVALIFFSEPLSKDIKGKLFFLVVAFFGLVFMMYSSGAMTKLLNDRQSSRLDSYKRPCDKLLSTGNQVCNGYIAINNGGLEGVGLGKSTQKYLYLPEPYTDFIYDIIIEELGLIWGIMIIILYIVTLYKILAIGRASPTNRGAALCYGVAIYILIHIMVNLLGVLGLIPLTGVPLPFMSYGGSFTICLILALAAVQRVAIENGLSKK